MNLSIQSLHLAKESDYEVLKSIIIHNQDIRILISSRLPFLRLTEDIKIKKLFEALEPVEISIPNLRTRRKDFTNII